MLCTIGIQGEAFNGKQIWTIVAYDEVRDHTKIVSRILSGNIQLTDSVGKRQPPCVI